MLRRVHVHSLENTTITSQTRYSKPFTVWKMIYSESPFFEPRLCQSAGSPESPFFPKPEPLTTHSEPSQAPKCSRLGLCRELRFAPRLCRAFGSVTYTYPTHISVPLSLSLSRVYLSLSENNSIYLTINPSVFYIRVCICVYIYIYVHIYVSMYLEIYTRVSIYLYIYIYVYIYIYIYIYISICIYIYICMYVCMYVCIPFNLHIYVYLNAHSLLKPGSYPASDGNRQPT